MDNYGNIDCVVLINGKKSKWSSKNAIISLNSIAILG